MSNSKPIGESATKEILAAMGDMLTMDEFNRFDLHKKNQALNNAAGEIDVTKLSNDTRNALISHMTADEKAIYNTFLNGGNTEIANDYISNELQQVASEKWRIEK